MKVYALILRAEFDCEEFDDVTLYSNFDDAHKEFVAQMEEWLCDELFNVPVPTESVRWDDDTYDGWYTAGKAMDSLRIEERDNVVNFLSMRVECLEVK